MDLLRQGAEWLSSMRTCHAAHEVTYTRAGFVPARVPVTAGRSARTVEDSNGYAIRSYVRDFVLRVEDLQLCPTSSPSTPTRVTPQAGDRLSEGCDTDFQIFEITNIPGEDCWRFSDDHQLEYRVHTKYIGRGPPMPA